MSELEQFPTSEPDFSSPLQNQELELLLLGMMMDTNELFYEVSEIIKPSYFANPFHVEMYEQITVMLKKGYMVDAVSLSTAMRVRMAELEIEAVYFADIQGSILSRSAKMAIQYANSLKDLWQRREMLAISDQVRDGATSDNSVTDVLSGLEGAITSLSGDLERKGPEKFSTTLAKAVGLAEAAHKRGGGLSGLPSGFEGIDKLLGGLNKSDLIVIAGRPGMGKSALAFQIAEHVARERKSVAAFSLEMSADQLGARLLAYRSGVLLETFMQGLLKPEDFERVFAASREMESLDFFIDDRGGLTVAQIRSASRKVMRQSGLDLIVIDYLQLISSENRYRGNKVAEITEISASLKALAKELNVPVIALSQLSRNVESREDKTPRLSDLRESGAIEQDANSVVLLFRPDYYLRNSEPARKEGETEDKFHLRLDQWRTMLEAVEGQAKAIVAKNRNGPTGNVSLMFDGPKTRFFELDNREAA